MRTGTVQIPCSLLMALPLLLGPAPARSQTAGEPPPLEQLLAQLQSPDPSQRLAAAEVLGDMGPEAVSALSILVAGTRDPSPSVRVACICSIGAIGDLALPAATTLRGLLSDPDPAVRMAAAASLGGIGRAARGFTDDLLKAAADTDPDVRGMALLSLAQLRCEPQRAAGVLEQAMKDSIPSVQIAALDAAASLGTRDPSTLQAMAGLVGNEREAVHVAATEAVQKTQGTDSAECLWPPNVWLPTSPPAPPKPEPSVAPGQRQWTPPGYQPPATTFPNPPPVAQEPTHRGKSLSGWIGELSSADADARWQACQALGEMGWRARPAIPALAAARDDRELRVRCEAIVALDKIRGRLPPPEPRQAPAGPDQQPAAPPAPSITGAINGYLYFVSPCQVMSLGGPQQRRDPVEADQLGALRLKWVSVEKLQQAEAALRQKGNPDPKTELDRLLATEDASLVTDCPEDYLLRLTCAGQQRFRSHHDRRLHGAVGDFALTGGSWHVDVSCVGRPGFRIDTGIDIMVKPIDGVADGLRITRENALKHRQALANSGNDYSRNQAANRLMFALEAHAGWLMADGTPPDDAMPIYNESIEVSRLAGGDAWYASHLFELVHRCAKIGSPKAYPVALRAMGEVEKLADRIDWRADMVCEGMTETGFNYISRAYWDLAHLAITCSNAVPVARTHAAQMLAWDWAELKSKGQANDAAREAWAAGQMDHWPDDWAGDQLDPPGLITGDIGKHDWGQVVTAGPPTQAPTTKPDEEEEEPRRELPDGQYWEGRWLESVRDDLAEIRGEAFSLKMQLKLQQDAAAKIQERISYLQGMLLQEPAVVDEDWFEMLTRKYDELVAGMGIARDLLKGEWKPQNAAEMRAYLERRIMALRQEHSTILREQDTTIKQLDDLYAGLVTEVQTKGPRCGDEGCRGDAEYLLKELRLARARDGCDLYMASGQRDKFKEAARELVGEQELASVGRLMQGLEYADHKEWRSAVEAFRKCLELDPGNQRAELMLRQIEVGYLQAIDRKTLDDAAEVRRVAWERLSQHGEPGFWGAIVDVCTTGVTTSYGALLGRHEDMANSAGQIQQEAAQQHCGLLIITRLREKGLSFEQMRALDNQAFVDRIQALFGQKISQDDAKRMRAAMMFGFRHSDVDRLVNGKLQLDVDIGTSYYDTEDFKESWGEWLGGMVNVKNVALMLGPSAVVSAGGQIAVHGSALTASQLRTAVRARDVVAGWLHLGQAADRLWRSETGRRVIQEVMAFDRNTGLVSKMLADAIVQQAVVGTAERIGEAVGYGPETRLAAEILTSFGVGDYSTTVELLQRGGVRYRQMQALLRNVSDAVHMANRARVLDKSRMVAVNDALRELGEKGTISEAGRKALEDASAEVNGRLYRLVELIKQGSESATALLELQALKATAGAIEAARAGAGEPARSWQELAQELGDQLNRTGRHARRQQQVCQDLEGEMAQAPSPPPRDTLPPMDEKIVRTLPFGRQSLSSGPDRVLLRGHFKEASRQYGEMVETLRELGLTEQAPAVRELMYKRQMAQEALAAQRYLELYRRSAGELNARLAVAFAPAEVASISTSSSVKELVFTQLGDEPGTAYMVCRPAKDGGPAEQWVFKPDNLSYPHRNQAEVAIAGLAELAGRPCPAATHATLVIEGVPTSGVLMRYAHGVDLAEALQQFPGMRSAVKSDIAADWAFSAWVGDYDRHRRNYRVGTRGTPAIDRNLANPGELHNDNFQLEMLITDGLSAEPTRKRDQIMELMRRRLDFCKDHQGNDLYGTMLQIERQMTFEDMAGAIDDIMAIPEQEILAKLTPVYGDKANDVLEVLLIRRECLKEVLGQRYPSVGIPTPQTSLPAAVATAA